MIENNRSKDKLPRYIIAYNKILKMVQDGLYPEEAKLPTEPELAKQMGISRMTLRQALTMLQEDGIVESRQGVGNFIRKNLSRRSDGLEKIGNPIYKCCTKEIDNITCQIRSDIAVEYTDKILKRKVPVVLGGNIVYKNEGNSVAYTFSLLPGDLEYLKQVDLHCEAEIIKFITEDIYQYAKCVQYEIKIIPGDHIMEEYKLRSESGVFVMLLESLLGNSGEVLCYNKSSIPLDLADICVNSY